MQYRTFGKLDWQPAALGFGAMRLPILGEARLSDMSGDVNDQLALRVISQALDGGINYIDTAYDYHGGKSERIVGRCLKNGYRDKVKLATKLPSWKIESQGQCDQILDEQLAKLQTDHIDFYLFHALNQRNWNNIQKHQALEWAERALSDGRIRHLGFSFHDELPLFKEIVDAFDWTFCQIQHNYMDVEYQAGTDGLRYAAAKGLAIVIMEPLRGGALTQPAPEPIKALWEAAPIERTQADWGLQWLWNQPEISLVLSGMSTQQHVQENLASAARSGVGTLTQNELHLIGRIAAAYRELTPISCTECGYCQPCPSGVAIPHAFRLYNEAQMYNDPVRSRGFYNDHTPAQRRADQCTECGQCESLCPQQIKVIDWLKKAHKFLSAT
ncbi:aldo/keto reductase [Candidatus Bipolaricaulota bacterium]